MMEFTPLRNDDVGRASWSVRGGPSSSQTARRMSVGGPANIPVWFCTRHQVARPLTA